MKILATICLGTALLALPLASHADQLDNLDRLLESTQRKLEEKAALQAQGAGEQRSDGREAESTLSPGQPPQNFDGKRPAHERGTAGEVTELGSDDFRFTIEVPDGWTAENAERGGSVKKNDESSLLVFKKFSTGGMTASQFASEIGQKFGVELEKRNGTWVFQGEKDGTPLLIALSPKEEDGTAVVLICAGSDQGGMSRIFSTVKLLPKRQ